MRTTVCFDINSSSKFSYSYLPLNVIEISYNTRNEAQ